MLKNVKRSGWWAAGIKDPETVAEHCHRASVIGYFLARLENADSNKVLKMCIFHDIAEARINDVNKIGARYIDYKEAEKRAIEDQLASLPDNLSDELRSLLKEFHDGKTKEAVVAKDADWLECAIQAKEYMDSGYKLSKDWIDNVRNALKTKSARKLLDAVEKSESWWKGLKKLG